jgi:hypothetical protein
MQLKRLTIAILILLISFETNAQYVSTPEISKQEKIEEQKRADLKIASFKWMKSDSTYFYLENYNKNGQVISNSSVESGLTNYDYNSFGKKTRAYQIIDNKPDTIWNAQYKSDTLLFKVFRDDDCNYKEEIIYDNLEREIKRFKRYRKSDRIDSTITYYSGSGQLQISFEKGIPVQKMMKKKDITSSVEEYYNFIKPDSVVLYLTWSTKFDFNGNPVYKKQQFYDRKEKTEYLYTYIDCGFEKTATVKTNGKVEFETTNYYDKDNKIIRSRYKEKGYKTVTDYFYDVMNLESKEITRISKKGHKRVTETYISNYEFFTD